MHAEEYEIEQITELKDQTTSRLAAIASNTVCICRHPADFIRLPLCRAAVVWEGSVRHRASGVGVLLHRVHPAALLDRGPQRVLHRPRPLRQRVLEHRGKFCAKF